MKITIIGLLILDRVKEAGRTQKVLSKYGCLIKSRLGLHEVTEAVCSRRGIMLLDVNTNHENYASFCKELYEIGGLQVKMMEF